MTRKEMYNYIKNVGLDVTIKECEGKNYTNCSNEMLENYIKNYIDCKKCLNNALYPEVDIRVNRLIEVLEKKHILLKSEIDYINK